MRVLADSDAHDLTTQFEVVDQRLLIRAEVHVFNENAALVRVVLRLCGLASSTCVTCLRVVVLLTLQLVNKALVY